MAGNTNYNLNVAPLWETKQGNLRSIVIDAKVFDALQRVEEGGMFLIKFLADESRTKETSPHAYIEYVNKESVASFRNNTTQKKAGTTSRTHTSQSDDTL